MWHWMRQEGWKRLDWEEFPSSYGNNTLVVISSGLKGFGVEKTSGHISQWILSPSPNTARRGSFSGLYCENRTEFLEVKARECVGIPLRLWVPGVSLITRLSISSLASLITSPGIYQSVWVYGSSFSSWKGNSSWVPLLALISAVWGEVVCSVTSVLSWVL